MKYRHRHVVQNMCVFNLILKCFNCAKYVLIVPVLQVKDYSTRI